MCRSSTRLPAASWAAGLSLLCMLAAPAAFAQTHGITITKICDDEVRSCLSDADCSDDNACNGEETCDTSIPITTTCLIGVQHNDGFGDTTRVLQANDLVNPLGDPASGPNQVLYTQLPIAVALGNTTCVVGTTPETGDPTTHCLIGPADSTLEGLPGLPEPGTVVFLNDQYTVDVDDTNPIPDQGTVFVQDLCDAPNTTSCSTSVNGVSFTASSPLVDGCLDGTPPVCDDGSECTADSCDPETGCVYTPIVCDDSDACTTDSCDPATGCVYTPIVCDDSDACTTDSCDPATGCVYTPIVCDDSDACTTDSCDPATGCVYTPIVCDDGSLCTTDSCDPATGCVYTPVVCDDGDECTVDSCDETTGECVYEFDSTIPGCGLVEICRTPGFWGTHADDAKKNANNITQAVLDAAVPPIEICGNVIDNTDVYCDEPGCTTSGSAVEELCVAVRGTQKEQLERQLTAAALNCVISGGGSDCTGMSIETTFQACNLACETDGDIGDCIEALDAFNNGYMYEGGMTYMGVCEEDPTQLCNSDYDCIGYCQPVDSCHDEPLVNEDLGLNYEPPGSASPKPCTEAIMSK